MKGRKMSVKVKVGFLHRIRSDSGHPVFPLLGLNLELVLCIGVSRHFWA